VHGAVVEPSTSSTAFEDGLMVWDYDLETRHAEIDQDHQEVVAFMTALLKVIDAGHNDRVPGALATFTERVTRHFAFEERLMEQAAFAGVRDHKDAHKAFLSDIKRFTDQLATAGVTESFRQWAHGRLVSWFRFHIKAYDIGLARALMDAKPK
jgi:hemerythrin